MQRSRPQSRNASSPGRKAHGALTYWAVWALRHSSFQLLKLCPRNHPMCWFILRGPGTGWCLDTSIPWEVGECLILLFVCSQLRRPHGDAPLDQTEPPNWRVLGIFCPLDQPKRGQTHRVPSGLQVNQNTWSIEEVRAVPSF